MKKKELLKRIEELNDEIVNLRERILDLESNKINPYVPYPYIYPYISQPWEKPTKTWPDSGTYPGVNPYPYIVTC